MLKFREKWGVGIWAGRDNLADMHIILTKDGALTARSVRRLAPNEAADPQLQLAAKRHPGRLKALTGSTTNNWLSSTRIAHADCKSLIKKILSHSSLKGAWLNAASPKRVPNTMIPCWVGSTSVSLPPRQTRASGSLNCAMRSSASQPLGLILALPFRVFPPWLMLAYECKCCCNVV